MKLFNRIFLTLVSLVSCLSLASADPINFKISGMAGMPGGRTFLTVLDTKTGPEPPWSTRAGIMRVSDAGELVYQPFALTDWGHGEELPNDLEACCPIPGRPNEYLLAESGYYQGRFGRIFHVRLSPVKGSALYTAEVLGAFRPEPRLSDDYSTPGPQQFEGIACLQSGEEWVMILGRRGGDGEAGELIWGTLDFDTLDFQRTGSAPFQSEPERLGLRGCADLLLVERDGKQVLLRVASADPADLGPFYSFVVETGEFEFKPGKLTYKTFSEPKIWWHLDGLKVEALAPCNLGTATYCIGTDDEIFGGAWRPLAPPRIRKP